MPTPVRPVRVPDEVWDAAVAKAKAEGTSASAVIVKALKRYITRPPRRQHAPESDPTNLAAFSHDGYPLGPVE